MFGPSLRDQRLHTTHCTHLTHTSPRHRLCAVIVELNLSNPAEICLKSNIARHLLELSPLLRTTGSDLNECRYLFAFIFDYTNSQQSFFARSMPLAQDHLHTLRCYGSGKEHQPFLVLAGQFVFRARCRDSRRISRLESSSTASHANPFISVFSWAFFP